MKRTVAYVLTSLLTFNCGIISDSLFTGHPPPTEKPASRPDVPFIPVTPAPTDTEIPAPVPDIVFGGGRLRLLPEEVRLKSQRLQYDVNVRYPQILGTNELHIQRLNRRIKELATEQYQRMLHPSKEDLLYYRQKFPEAFNELSIDYEVTLATDPVLSIYFVGYSYGIGAGTSVQYSFTINYDLVAKKELKLSELFQHRSNHLQFISRYCTDRLAAQEYGKWLFKEGLVPVASNFDSWNITRDGIRINFDECQVEGCAGGEHAVEIPFANLKSILSARTLSILRL